MDYISTIPIIKYVMTENKNSGINLVDMRSAKTLAKK